MPPLLFAFICMLFGNIIAQQNPRTICPPSDIISPCVCLKSCDVCAARIECKNILSISQLNEIFEKSSDYSFWNFYIENSSFLYLPSAAVVEKKVRNLFLRNNIMMALFDEAPLESNLLKEMELTDLRLQGGMRWEVFSSLIHLEDLNLTKFELRKIDQSFINNFPQGLKGLFLTDTKTKELGSTAFARLIEMTRIFVDQTQIRRIERSMFPEISKLVAMHFTGNQISSLPSDIFSNMPALQGVGFSNTHIASLPESVFGAIMPQLALLFMENNEMNCNCQMKWIANLPAYPFYLKVICTEPALLAGKSIKELKPSDFLHCE